MANITSWLTTSTPAANNTGSRNVDTIEHFQIAETEAIATPKMKRESPQTLAIAQRTRALFNVITRPPLLHAPSLGIDLPFAATDVVKLSAFETISKGLKELACSDPCLLSVDGMLDGMFAARNVIEHLYDDCCAMQDRRQTEANAATLNVLEFFLTRIDPILEKIAELRVSMKDFKLGEIIGRGACGVVRVVSEKAPPNSVFAMKSQFKGSWLYHDPEGAQLLLERTVLAQATMIDNPWLPHLHYAFQDETQLHLVMDYEPGGDMYIFLSKASHLLDSEMIQFYAAEVVEAAHSLHKMGYIHCDIKPENFAIERSGHLRLIDFGSAIRLSSDGKCICPTMVGTKEYLNVELLTQRKYGDKSATRVGPDYDYWAVGVFIYEMFYSQTPFFDEDDDKMMDNIVNFKTTLEFPRTVDVSDRAKDLIRRLVCHPDERLSYEEIVKHSFFQDVDFATIRQHRPPYLPPVGELDDVANFSGGGARTRDEMLLNISNDKTMSPSRGRLMGGGTSVAPAVLGDSQSHRRLSNLENCEPPGPLSEKEKQRKAIYEAASAPVTEDVQEVEDIEWQGPGYAIDLPFIGFSFTPTMLLGDSRSRQQAMSALNPQLPVCGDTTIGMQSRLSLLDISGVTEEAATKIIELKRRNRFLEKQLTLHEEEAQKMRQRLNASAYSADVLSVLDSSLSSNMNQKSQEKQEIIKLEARVNSLTLEKAKVVDELNEMRRCLLDFDKVKSLLNSVDRKAVDEAKSLRIKLDCLAENNRIQEEELSQVRMQLERLRSSNSRLVAERDAALERVAKAEDVASSQADEAEAARAASQREVVRLTTTTEQQGKLIKHMLSLLPAERRRDMAAAASAGVVIGIGGSGVPSSSSGSTASSGARPKAAGRMFSQSRWMPQKSSAGHSALFFKTKSILKTAMGGGGPSTQGDAAECSRTELPPVPRALKRSDHHQPKRRMAAWVRTLSTLRSTRKHHNNTITDHEPNESVDYISDYGEVYAEDDGRVEAEESGHIGVYIGDNASLVYPAGDDDEVQCGGIVSDIDYFRGSTSSMSTAASVAPSLASLPEHSRRILWAGGLNPNVGYKQPETPATAQKSKPSQPRLLKQISRVLGKGKSRTDDP